MIIVWFAWLLLHTLFFYQELGQAINNEGRVTLLSASFVSFSFSVLGRLLLQFRPTPAANSFLSKHNLEVDQPADQLSYTYIYIIYIYIERERERESLKIDATH